MERMRPVVQGLIAGLVGMWGGIPELTRLLVLLMALDLLLGVMAGLVNNSLTQQRIWKAVTQKAGGLAIVLMMAWLQPHVGKMLEVNLVQISSAFYIVPELTGIIKNAGVLGVPIPKQLNTVVSYFSTVSGEEKKDAAHYPKNSG